MFFYLLILQQLFKRIKSLAKLHFIIEPVQPTVAIATNGNGLLQHQLTVMFFEVLSTMQLSRNKMMGS